MSKYIIKNCPAYGKRFYLDNNVLGTYVQCICKDNDCIIKQIVELCKGEQQSRVAINILSNSILKLLDIQEVE